MVDIGLVKSQIVCPASGFLFVYLYFCNNDKLRSQWLQSSTGFFIWCNCSATKKKYKLQQISDLYLELARGENAINTTSIWHTYDIEQAASDLF